MNVLILGAKPAPASPACPGSDEILARLERIEKCLEEIEMALAEKRPGTARKASSEGTARARKAVAGEAAKTPSARKAKA